MVADLPAPPPGSFVSDPGRGGTSAPAVPTCFRSGSPGRPVSVWGRRGRRGDPRGTPTSPWAGPSALRVIAIPERGRFRPAGHVPGSGGLVLDRLDPRFPGADVPCLLGVGAQCPPARNGTVLRCDHPGVGAHGDVCPPAGRAEMDPLRAQQLAAELEVEMMADMYNRWGEPGTREGRGRTLTNAPLGAGQPLRFHRCRRVRGSLRRAGIFVFSFLKGRGKQCVHCGGWTLDPGPLCWWPFHPAAAPGAVA